MLVASSSFIKTGVSSVIYMSSTMAGRKYMTVILCMRQEVLHCYTIECIESVTLLLNGVIHFVIIYTSRIYFPCNHNVIRNTLTVASSPEVPVPTVSMAAQNYYYRINYRSIWKGSAGSLLFSVHGAQRKYTTKR